VLWGHGGDEIAITGNIRTSRSMKVLGEPQRPERQTSFARAILLVLVLTAVGAVVLSLALRPDPDGERYELSYRVRVLDAREGVLEVEMVARGMKARYMYLTTARSSPLDKQLPARFRVRELLNAEGEVTEVVPGESHWRIRAKGGGISLRYEVWLKGGIGGGAFSKEMLSEIDPDGARLVGSDIFLFPVFGDPVNLDVEYELPEGWALIHPFQVSETHAVVPRVKSLYHSVVGLGPYRVLEREARGCRLRLAMRGDFQFADQDLLDTIGQLASVQMDVFGGALRDQYVFLVNPHPDSGDPHTLHYFGLHYEASMVLLIDSNTDKTRLQREPAQLCAHEFYHNWCGELIRQNRYDMNWFIEGVTEFYAYQSRLESDLLSFPEYAKTLNERFHLEYLASPLLGETSVASASRQVLQDPNVTRYTYSAGLFIAASLDATIDQVTLQEKSLDDLMFQLAQRAKRDPRFLLTRETLQEELKKLTGEDFSGWLDRFVYGTEAPLLADYITREMAMR
jgi:predicted metalloprotease with PDZ domain